MLLFSWLISETLFSVYLTFNRLLRHKMDIVLQFYDNLFLSPYIFSKLDWPENYPVRQFISLNILVNINAAALYMLLACANYYFIFDRAWLRHPLYLRVSNFYQWYIVSINNFSYYFVGSNSARDFSHIQTYAIHKFCNVFYIYA